MTVMVMIFLMRNAKVKNNLICLLQTYLFTLKVENFAGTKFCGFRGFRGQPRNLIPAKPLTLPIREI